MSSNLNTLSSSALASRTNASAAAELANSLSAGEGAPDGQHFADWMAQHRDVQKPLAAQQQATPSPLPGGNQAGKLPTAMAHPSTVAKATVAPQAAVADKPKAMTAPRPASKPAEAQANKNNAANKTAAKSPESGEGKDSESTQSDGRDVAFKTAQGEGSTYVQELQPPAELSTSDPAAMLAWLASLTQSGAAPADAAALGGEAAAAATSQEGAEALPGRGRGQDPLTGGHAALALGAKDAMASAGAADGDAAKGQSGQHEPGTDAIDFSTLMTREMGRTPSSAGGPEATRHHTGNLATPVDSPDFGQALADRVGMWVSGSALGGPMTAELRLNPAEMGPVHIRIELDGQNAVVDFAAANAQTREAIEASLPMLSGALEDVGLSLSGGGVSDQGTGQQAWAGQQQDQQQTRNTPWGGTSDRLGGLGVSSDVESSRPERLVNQRAGGLDLYA